VPIKIHACAAVLALALAASAVAAVEPQRLDDGRLDPAWFGSGVEFRTTSVIDYVWVKPGFSLKGKKLRVEEWPEPVFVAKERRARDAARAYELAEQMPLRLRTVLRRSLQGFAEVTTESLLDPRAEASARRGQNTGSDAECSEARPRIIPRDIGEVLIELLDRRHPVGRLAVCERHGNRFRERVLWCNPHHLLLPEEARSPEQSLDRRRSSPHVRDFKIHILQPRPGLGPC